MSKKYKVIDLFCGIGGFHSALHKLGGSCIAVSEIDKFARVTYEANYKKSSPFVFDNDLFLGDIRNIKVGDIFLKNVIYIM